MVSKQGTLYSLRKISDAFSKRLQVRSHLACHVGHFAVAVSGVRSCGVSVKAKTCLGFIKRHVARAIPAWQRSWRVGVKPSDIPMQHCVEVPPDRKIKSAKGLRRRCFRDHSEAWDLSRRPTGMHQCNKSFELLDPRRNGRIFASWLSTNLATSGDHSCSAHMFCHGEPLAQRMSKDMFTKNSSSKSSLNLTLTPKYPFLKPFPENPVYPKALNTKSFSGPPWEREALQGSSTADAASDPGPTMPRLCFLVS